MRDSVVVFVKETIVNKSKYLQILCVSVASGLSVRDASKIAGCTESTGYSLSCSDEFRSEVNRIKTEAVERAVCRLTDNAVKASDTLARLLDSADEKVALSAAVKLLSMLGPLSELAELRARVDRIESQTSLRIAK